VPDKGKWFQSGFTVEIIDTEDKVMLKQSGAQTPVRSTILQMSPFAYSKQYNASFLLSKAEAGAFTGVPYSSTCSAIPCGQYAYLETPAKGTDPGSWYFRFQDWTVGYSLSLTTPLALTFGGTLSATVTPLGSIGITASDNASLKVLKKTGDRVWLVDTTAGNGYIMTLED
jgi:hypothetical protein